MVIAKRGDDAGFALLLVLVALAVLSLVIAATIDSARRYGDEAASKTESVRLRAGLDAAIATAGRDLAEADTGPPPLLSRPQTIVLDGIRVTVSLRPEASKIDLNASAPALIAALLLASGLEAKFAQRLSDEIVDWRDGDSETRPHGAKTADYVLAGKSYGPPNHGFESVSELALLRDGSGDLVDCLAPVLTVFTGRADIDLSKASPKVRRAAAMVAPPPLGTGLLAASIVGGRVVQAGELFEVDVAATSIATGQSLSRRTILRVTGDPRRPVWIVAQTSPVPRPAETTSACERLRRARPD